MVSKPFESSEGSAMDEEALVALGFQNLKKENDQLSKVNSGMAELNLESKSLLNDVRELKAMVYQYFNIPIPTHKVAKEVSIMASELSDQHKGTRCERIAVNKLPDQAAHQAFDETPKSENTTEIDGAESMEQEDSNRGEPIVVDELPYQIAHQVFEEMPKSIVTHEVKFLDEIGKKNDELVDGFDLKAPPIGSVERLDDVKALEEGKPRDAIPTIHTLKLDFSEQARMMNGIVNAICFDPGGTDLTYGDLAISLPNGNYESDAGEEKELIQVEGSEPVAVKEISDFIAHHVLDNMPSRETELMTELSRDNDTLNQQKLVVRVPAVPESKWDNKLDAIELLKVVDISTNGGLVTSLPNGAEKTTNELVTAEHELQVDAAPDDLKVFRGGLTMIYMGLMCFDPGGLLVINAFSCLIANENPHFGYSVGTLNFYPESYVAEVLIFLQAFDYEMSTYLGWSAKIKSCLLDVLKETSNMLSCSLGNTKPDEEHKTLKVFEVNDLQYIAPLLLAINEFSNFVQFPSKLPAQKVRMVDYIVVVCFNVWVFDPGGHLLIHVEGILEGIC